MHDAGSWTFLTNHAHVLLCLARDPDLRLRDVALEVGITERAAQRIVRDLAGAGYLTCIRRGRRNSYILHTDRALRHQLEAHRAIGDILLPLLLPAAEPSARRLRARQRHET